MYNEVEKEKFIAVIKRASSAEIARELFRVSEKYEVEAQKDLADFDVEDTGKIITENFSARNSVGNIDIKSSPKAMATNAANRYRRWVHGRNVEQVNYARAAKKDRIRKTMVRSPSELQEILDCVFRPIDAGTVDNVYRGFLWLIYSGVPKRDTVDIATDEVSILDMKIRHNGKDYPIYEEAVPLMKSLIESREMSIVRSKYSISKSRVDRDLLLSTTRKAKVSVFMLRSYIRERIKEAYEGSDREHIIPPEKLRMSGVFYRAYERDRAVEILGADASNGSDVTIHEEAVYQGTVATKADKEKDEANPKHVETRIKVIERELKKDYKLWLECGGGRV